MTDQDSPQSTGQIIDRNVETLTVVGLLIELSIKDSSAPKECMTSHTYKKTHFKRKACIDLECTLWNGVRGRYLGEFAWPPTCFRVLIGYVYHAKVLS